MNVVFDAPLKTTKGVAIVHNPEELVRLKDAGTAAAIWQRRPLPAFQSWVDELDPSQLPSVRITMRPQKIETVLHEVCGTMKIQDGPQRKRFIDDVSALTQIFGGVVSAPFIRMRLDRVTTNACRKFHTDAITARLVCTYRGVGTQYGTSVNGSEPHRIFTVPTCSPILMRGTLWPEHPRSGFLHRSPPIEGSGKTRLVLVIDPVFDPENEA